MLSYIPLVLFGSMAAAAFMIGDDDPEDQDNTGEDRTDLEMAGDVDQAAPQDLLHDFLSDVDTEPTLAEASAEDEPTSNIVLLPTLAVEEVDAFDDDSATEVLSVEIDDEVSSMFDAMPGPETGFRTSLAAEDELELNIADDVDGRVATVQAVHDLVGSAGSGDVLLFSLNFYVVPEDVELPETGYEGTETDFINIFEAQKLGEVDLGRFETITNAETGDTEIAEDTRQTDPPKVISNRDVVVMDALFT